MNPQDQASIARIADKLEGQYLDSIEADHHEYCPINRARNEHSTLCMCVELRKADRDAAMDEKYDRMGDR